MRGPPATPSLGCPNAPTEVGLSAGNRAIETHHRGDPVIDGVIARIAFAHCQFANIGNLNGCLTRAPFELGCCRNTIDDFCQAARSPCGSYDRIRAGLACQNEGTENLGVARTVICNTRIIGAQAPKESASALGNPVQLLAQLEWSGTCWSSSIKPIPECCRFELLCMVCDLPDVHADGRGDFFKIRSLVCGDRNAVTAIGHEQPNKAETEAGHYINELLGANQTLAPSHGENGASSPLGSATSVFQL
jgi:hypothetical protein